MKSLLDDNVKLSRSNQLRRFLTAIYAYTLFNDLVFIYAYYAVMFSDYGLSAMRISVLFAVWSIMAFVLEIPSGALADRYSRKNLLILGQFIRILGYICWMLYPKFWGFLIGFVCWGVKSAFTSGTYEALIYDELKHFRAESKYAKVIGRTRSFAIVGVLLSEISAVGMVRFGYRYLIAASLLSLTASCISALFIHPAKKAGCVGEMRYFALFKEGVREVIHNRAVLRLTVFTSIGLCFLGVLDEYWTLFFKAAGIPNMGIGGLCAVKTAICVLIAVVAYRLKNRPDKVFFAIYLAVGLSLAVGAYVMRPVSVISVIICCSLLLLVDINMEARLQHAIEGHARATVLSVRGFLKQVMAVLIYMGFGATAAHWHYKGGFLACAGVMILIGALYLMFSGSSVTNADVSNTGEISN